MGFACRGFLLVAAFAALVAAPTASPSQLLDDNATGVKLAVNGKGEALVTYTANGKQKRVLVVGRGQRESAGARAEAGRVPTRLLRRLRQVPHDVLEDVRLDVPAVRRPAARVARDRVQGAGRLVLGAAVLAAEAEELRRALDRTAPAAGSCTSRTGPAPCPCSRSRWTRRRRRTTTCSASNRSALVIGPPFPGSKSGEHHWPAPWKPTGARIRGLRRFRSAPLLFRSRSLIEYRSAYARRGHGSGESRSSAPTCRCEVHKAPHLDTPAGSMEDGLSALASLL